MAETTMRVRFWGTRGSIPSCSRETLRYGGNTTCSELRTSAGTVFILDCGSGARELGQHLMASQSIAPSGTILLSHLHWDHIHGMPFFAPLFNAGSEWDVYGPSPSHLSLRDALTVQMSPPFFPVHLDSLPATIRFHDLGEDSFQLHDAHVTTQYLNHPGPTLGYRIEVDGAVVVYVCDHEPHGFADSFLAHEFDSIDLRHIAFLEGADLVIHDAQYIAKEFRSRRGWGHSVGDYVVEVCRRAGVARVALTHHDPSRSDESIDDYLARLHHAFKGKIAVPEIIAAAEGLQLDV